jgi:[glutamine synthetase] adenylyltransferase / [glutamine synthetase]-adenylyl-L-tyrosine phosphorylase
MVNPQTIVERTDIPPWKIRLDSWAARSLVRDPARAGANLEGLLDRRVPLELFEVVLGQIDRELPQLSDPDMALNNLERFFAASRSPLSLAALFERDPKAIPILLRIFSTSQYLSDLLVRDPAAWDGLRLTAGQPLSREVLVDEVTSLMATVDTGDREQAMRLLRRFKQREILRIAFGDIVAWQSLETVTSQISHLAEAICEAGLAFALRHVAIKYGTPRDDHGHNISMVVLAMGKLGGGELNYSSDIDLVLLYRDDGRTTGPHRIEASEYFERVARVFLAVLNDQTADGVAWRVDFRLRPNGSAGPLSTSIPRAAAYYDMRGRTWERQALVKARAVAGDVATGEGFLQQLQSWIYGPRLSMTEINGIRALKRQIERRALLDGHDETNVKTGRGGIRDIEFATQFLQLLHGGMLREVRTGNTLEGLNRLYQARCLSFQEYTLLEQAYRWLRRLEHRLQIMFDLQTHTLPIDEGELQKVAMRMALTSGSTVPGPEPHPEKPHEVLEQFRVRLKQITGHNRVILDHLLHNAFPGGDDESGSEGSEEADLILDAGPDEAWIVRVLGRYGFSDPIRAHRNLLHLATEKNRFLSPHRCRHFLAAIAARLITELALTPSPDETLNRLTSVSESLGGKAILWELFSQHPPTMKMYVRLCAACDYLCDLLVRNPGMVDELMDSLILPELPSYRFLDQSLRELLAGAEDPEPIIHSFRDAQHLRVGAREILGQDDIGRTSRALADIAEVCLTQVMAAESRSLQGRFGAPGAASGVAPEMTILALGKTGGREPNYHSDLDLIFVYTGEGDARTEGGRDSTTLQDYFSRLAASFSKRVSMSGRYGKLYEIDSRLRPTGKSGSLAVSEAELIRYFATESGQLWERLAMCRARAICASGETSEKARALIARVLTCIPWESGHADEVFEMRLRMEQGASPGNIKRGIGGAVDIEFAVQMLQLRYARRFPQVIEPNTSDAANALREIGALSDDDCSFFIHSYKTLRKIEARIRLMNTVARHDLPADAGELARLAWLIGATSTDELTREIAELRKENRQRFLRIAASCRVNETG